jgi:uroporphyrinogen decarboxylase
VTKREVVAEVLSGRKPPYVPWHCGFQKTPLAKLMAHLGTDEWETAIGNHFLKLGHSTGYVTPIGGERYRDPFGVVWNRTFDKDIGVIEGAVLPEPTLAGYTLPDPEDDLYFRDIPEKVAKRGDCFRLYCIGFSLFERAWSMRGFENLLLDFYENPQFVHDLLDAICDYNIARVRKALTFDIDGVYFGDDWGQQSGLIMGPKLWRQFLRPRLERMYAVAKSAGKFQLIHSCGDIRSLIDELSSIGVDCINPFQPEALPVFELLEKYRGKVAFHGGLSTQRTLPQGTVADVRRETRALLDAGRDGGLIFAPAHAVSGDTPLENMQAFLDEVRNQPGV